MNLAPIVLFAYARPHHTRQTLEALAKNTGAEQSDLYVYADAPRSECDQQPVKEVRQLLRSAKGFNAVTVIERETNYGLAKNITSGVNEICAHYGRAIVLEDDIVTSPNFLRFMNAALDRYENDPRVWHISGWNYPIDPAGLGEAFFWRVMNCWGWGTWADRWAYFEKNPRRLARGWQGEDIERFNLDGAHNFWGQVTENRLGKINTWAIFWYATIFERGGLCLNPACSLVHNIGHDGSGANCQEDDSFDSVQALGEVRVLPDRVEELELAVERVKRFYRVLDTNSLKRAAMYFGRIRRRFTEWGS